MTAMLADVAREAFSEISVFKASLDGIRVATHCVYASFEPVSVSINRVGDGFRVGDLGGAYDAAWLHGREDRTIRRSIYSEAMKYGLHVSGHVIVSDVVERDWLSAAIISVANASASAANNVICKFIASSEMALVDRIQESLSVSFGPSGFVRDYEIKGKSGGSRHFDFAIQNKEQAILINGISPHHSSVSAKYVSFSDADVEQENKFAVFDKKIGTDDAALLQQVALVVPLVSLGAGAKRVMRSTL